MKPKGKKRKERQNEKGPKLYLFFIYTTDWWVVNGARTTTQ